MHQAHFPTADFELAATILAAIDTRLLCIRRDEGEQPRFVFAMDDVLEVVESYWNSEIRVDPIIFTAARRYLQDRLDEPATGGEDMPTGTHFMPPFRPDATRDRCSAQDTGADVNADSDELTSTPRA